MKALMGDRLDELTRYNDGTDIEFVSVDDVRAMVDDMEVALAQATALAEYVEEHAKGKMEQAAKQFLSNDFAEELRTRLATKRQRDLAFDFNTELLRKDGDANLAVLWGVVRAAGGEVKLPVIDMTRYKHAVVSVTDDETGWTIRASLTGDTDNPLSKE